MDLYKKHYAELEEIINTRLGMAIQDAKFNVSMSEHRQAQKDALDEAKNKLLSYGVESKQASIVLSKVWRDINKG